MLIGDAETASFIAIPGAEGLDREAISDFRLIRELGLGGMGGASTWPDKWLLAGWLSSKSCP
ncbi:MAG: hypothetical protein ACI97A_000552 [Planctomycetota bacterium]|jgi:hypothetical protein